MSINKKKIWIYCFLIAMVTHGYAFCHVLVSHDSLQSFILEDSWQGRIENTRCLNPVIRYIFGAIFQVPWLEGIVAMAMLSLVVLLVADMFQLDEKLALAIGGILISNISITALIASYFHDLLPNVVALLCAIVAAWYWKRNVDACRWKTFFVTSLLLGISLGIYQAYILSFVMFVVIDVINDLMQEKTQVKRIIVNGGLAVGACILACGVYLFLSRVSVWLTGVEVARDLYNSPHNVSKLSITKILSNLKETYIEVFSHFVFPSSYTRLQFVISMVANILIGLVCFGMIAFGVKKTNNWLKRILMVVIIFLLPVFMNGFTLISWSHTLMYYAFDLLYLLAIVLVKGIKKKWIQKIVLSGIIMISFVHIQVANTTYVKKNLEFEATQNVMNRVLERIENIDGYRYNETPIAFIGGVDVLGKQSRFGNAKLIGNEISSTITGYANYEVFAEYFMGYQMVSVDVDTLRELEREDEIKRMPVFPEAGSVCKRYDMIIVKMGEARKD